MANISHFTQTVNGVSTTYDIHDASAIPRSGGAVMTGTSIASTNNTQWVYYCGGIDERNGSSLLVIGKDSPNNAGAICLSPNSGTRAKYNWMRHDGTWTWDGTACQITSDQRLKQQIAEIDDNLLDAWEDVEPVQFRYNDAVNEKGTKARLHTGYVVQQIDKACKEHGVDISAYGLYCHEEYAEETREVEQADGTKTIEVVRPASEHYSLRYTECLVVECKYLRRCIKQLTAGIEQLTARIEQLEKGKEQEASK